MTLLERAGFIDQALEDATSRFWLQRSAREGGELIQDPALALPIEHGHAVLAFELTHAQYQAHALRELLQDLPIDCIDLIPQGRKLRQHEGMLAMFHEHI